MIKFYQFHGTKQEIAAIKAVIGNSPSDHSIFERPIYRHMQECLGEETVYEYSLKRQILNPNVVAAIKRVAAQYPRLLWIIAEKDLNTPVVYQGERLANYNNAENGERGFPGPFGALCLKYGVPYYGKSVEETPPSIQKDQTDRDMAEMEISNQGYAGFSDGKTWWCISHTIDHLGGEWEPLLAFATRVTTEMPGDLRDSWHEYSIGNEQAPGDIATIRCEAIKEDGEVCDGEIFLNDEEDDEEEEDVPVKTAEYALDYFGGEYSGLREEVKIPKSLLETVNPDESFERYTGLSRVHIISWPEATEEEMISPSDIADAEEFFINLARVHLKVSECASCQAMREEGPPLFFEEGPNVRHGDPQWREDERELYWRRNQ